MKNVFIINMTDDYYVDIAKKLEGQGCVVKVIAAGRLPDFWPSSLNEFIKTSKPRVIYWDDSNTPESFNEVLDPDYSFLTLDLLQELSYYEKIFLMTTDRISFFPISQIDRIRLFYRLLGHIYKLLKEEKIDAVVFFGMPHGLYAITLFGLAKVLGLKAVYTEWVGISAELSLIEPDIRIRRSYSSLDLQLGNLANQSDMAVIKQLVTKFEIASECVWNQQKPKNIIKMFVRAIGSLLLRRPFERNFNPEFFLNSNRKMRIYYVMPMVKYYIDVIRATIFYDKHAVSECEDSNSLALFLHYQPEASTMPQSGIFADQLLVLDLILDALPKGMTVYVKEHPFMFDQSAQDRHERSVEFYEHMLRDPRVRFVKKTVSSQEVMKKVKYVASANGSISWEAMRSGKPCIIFGWAWFASCQSCFVVDSVASLKNAFDAIPKKDSGEVAKDVNNFLEELAKRLIFAAAYRFSLDYAEDGLAYDVSVANLSKAIAISID